MKKFLLLTFIGSLFVAGNAMAHCGACEPHSHDDAAKVSCCSDTGKCCKEAKADCADSKKACDKAEKADCEGKTCCSDTGTCCKSKEACEDKGDETAAAPTAAPCCPKA